jgi:hypothetical protein
LGGLTFSHSHFVSQKEHHVISCNIHN